MAGVCQGLIWYSSAIAWKGGLGHFERMDDEDSPTLYVWLALPAALCGACSVTIYTTLARVMLWIGLAPSGLADWRFQTGIRNRKTNANEHAQ
jgi:hypothetical protein